MSTAGVSDTPLRKAIRHELQAIRGKWILLVALGISLIVLGTILLGSPVIATLATVTALGVLILVGGGMEVVGAFWCQEWSGFFLALLSGILGVVVGLMLLVFLLTKLDLNSRCVFCKPLPHLVVRPRPLHGAGITMIVFWP